MAQALRQPAPDSPAPAAASPAVKLRLVPEESTLTDAPTPDMQHRLLAVQLPTPSPILLKLLHLCQSEDTGMNELSELVGQDPAMTAKVLTVAHSAAFHRNQDQTLTLFQACSRLGTALIKVLVISESVLQTFNAFSHSIDADLRPFWRHSLTTAVLARELAKRLDNRVTEEAYLSGLLHDVGRLALVSATDNRFHDLFVTDDNDGLCAREQAAMGMTHVQASAWLLEKWHLDADLVESVSQHHADALLLVDTHPLTRILNLAHRLGEIPQDDLAQVAHLAGEQGLSSDDLKAVLQNASLQVEQIARDLGLQLSAPTVAPRATPAHRAPSSGALDDSQSQLAHDVFDRSVFNEMAMTLVGQRNMQSTLACMREHASALLQLENSAVFLLRDKPRMMVAASISERHRKPGPMSFGVDSHPPLALCVERRTVVFTQVDDEDTTALHQFMDADTLVLIPLVTSQSVFGVLVGAVPDELDAHLRGQSAKLQAFGVYAGLALARRHQADKLRRAQMAIARQEGRIELLRISRDVKQLIEQYAGSLPLGAVDLCTAAREMVQLLQDSQLIPDDIHIQSQLTDRQALVHGSADMIKQIIHMLLKNAWEAMPQGGEVLIEVGALIQRQGTLYTALTVSDNAVGTSTQSVQAELYEPLTPKTLNDQRMQSLGIVNYLSEKMLGQVKFTADEFGTRFEVLLPCARATPTTDTRP